RTLAQHPGVEIAAWPTTDVGQIGRIDVIGTNLERLDRHAASFVSRDQSGGEDRFSDVARGPRNDQPWSANLVQHPASLSLAKQGASSPKHLPDGYRSTGPAPPQRHSGRSSRLDGPQKQGGFDGGTKVPDMKTDAVEAVPALALDRIE